MRAHLAVACALASNTSATPHSERRPVVTEATLWRRGPFRRVVAGETLSQLGASSFQIVLAWLVLAMSGSAATLAGVLVAAAVPRGVLMLLGGAVTDRWSPRTVMLICHLGRGLAVAALTASAAFGALQISQFLAVAVALGVADAFFWPASGSIVPSLVSMVQLARANAVTAVSEQVGGLAGPLLGALLLAVTTPAFALGFTALTFTVAAATVATAPRRGPILTTDGRSEPVRALMHDLREGLAHARRDPKVRVVLLLVSAATLSYSGLFGVGLPALAQHYPNGSVVLGSMVSAWGLGQLTGALSASRTGLPRHWGRLIIAMTVIEGAVFAVLGLVPTFALAIVLLALLGFGVAYSTDVALPTFIQTQTPERLLGRVNSVINLPRVALEPLSLAGMGLLLQINLRLTFIVAAIPMLLVGARLALSRTARTLRTEPPSPVVAQPSDPQPTERLTGTGIGLESRGSVDRRHQAS